MAENSKNYVATVGVQAVAEQGNLIAEFRKILEDTSKTLAKDGGVTIHSDTSAATAEVQKFIKDTTALLEKGLGDIDLGSLAKDFAAQMSSVQGEIKGISEQMRNLNKLMEGFGSGASKNLGELEKRTEGTRAALSKLKQQSQQAAQATDAQIKSEKELQATLIESKKKAQEYTKELKKLDDKKEQSKAAKNALSTIDESKRIEALKAQWAEMQKVQADINRGGIARSDGGVTKYTAEGLERTKNKLNEIKKTVIDLQQSLTGVDFAAIGMQDITGEDEA
jgi:chromosome segregation ATPase